MFSKISIIAAVFAGLAVAQNNTTYIDPSTIDLSTKASWCNGEHSTCSYLCYGEDSTNSCDSDTLTYSCICSNGSAPGLQYYENSMPYYICTTSYKYCIQDHPNDAASQDRCKTDIYDQCGTLDAANVTSPTATTSSASSSSASATASSTSGTVASASAKATGAATALKIGSEYGLGVAAAAGAAAFGLLL